MSSTGCARNGPLIPPVTNRDTNPIANSIGEENGNFPRQRVPSQLKDLIADGTPIAMVMIENANAVYGLIPLINIAWHSAMHQRHPIDSMSYTIALHPKSGLRILVMPLARISSVVVMKFRAPISAPMQKIAMLIIHRSAPRPSPGPADCNALSGA